MRHEVHRVFLEYAYLIIQEPTTTTNILLPPNYLYRKVTNVSAFNGDLDPAFPDPDAHLSKMVA